MKFRYKVLIANIILLSISLGVVGYLMIQRNFNLSKNSLIHSAVAENNLIQTTVEFELLDILSKNDVDMVAEMNTLGKEVIENIQSDDVRIYLKYKDVWGYPKDGSEAVINEILFDNMTAQKKQYEIQRIDDSYYAFVICAESIDDEYLYIISQYNISEAYTDMDEQIEFFRDILLVVALVDALVMYLISMYITGPLEKLKRMTTEIANGNYDDRVLVKTRDEVGDLAANFDSMAEAIERRIEELNDMVASRDRFVADFTHEIKTPMTTIIGYADTMRSRELTREQQEQALNYIFSEGVRLEKMSKKLFELIYYKQHSVEMGKINTLNFADAVKKMVSPALEAKGIDFKVQVQEALILGNEELLMSVFINLIDNARKASKPGTTISFTGEMNQPSDEIKEATFIFKVKDMGIGMSPEDVKNMCDEFYMADKSRARKEGGAGLGMSIVKIILDKHGADFTVESELGHGTEITVTLKTSRLTDNHNLERSGSYEQQN